MIRPFEELMALSDCTLRTACVIVLAANQVGQLGGSAPQAFQDAKRLLGCGIPAQDVVNRISWATVPTR